MQLLSLKRFRLQAPVASVSRLSPANYWLTTARRLANGFLQPLLRQRQLLTGYQYFFNFGFGYSFGSIFNNIVNPRFGGGG